MNRLIEILLVEDNPGDVELTREALSRGRITNSLRVVNDGEQALLYLRKQGEYANAITPDIVLLDLNLPKLNGHQVLAEVKADEALKLIPIIVLSSSEDNKDIQTTYQLSANSFVTKPVQVDKFLNVVKAIEDFWIQIVKLPNNE